MYVCMYVCICIYFNTNRFTKRFVFFLKGVHTFPKGICPKVNVIGKLRRRKRNLIHNRDLNIK